MDLDQLKHLLTLVEQHRLAELEIEHEGLRIRIRRESSSVPSAAPPAPAVQPAAPASVAAPPAPAAVASAASVAAAGEAELSIVKSPIVGTFYRSAEPEASALVEVGSVVKKGQVLCIIEAMKLMNEIDSEYDGEVVNIYVENGQAVQYGERLFAIRTR